MVHSLAITLASGCLRFVSRRGTLGKKVVLRFGRLEQVLKTPRTRSYALRLKRRSEAGERLETSKFSLYGACTLEYIICM
jgi:hypothetical protein